MVHWWLLPLDTEWKCTHYVLIPSKNRNHHVNLPEVYLLNIYLINISIDTLLRLFYWWSSSSEEKSSAFIKRDHDDALSGSCPRAIIPCVLSPYRHIHLEGLRCWKGLILRVTARHARLRQRVVIAVAADWAGPLVSTPAWVTVRLTKSCRLFCLAESAIWHKPPRECAPIRYHLPSPEKVCGLFLFLAQCRTVHSTSFP